MENENIFTLRKTDFKKYIKKTTARYILMKFLLLRICTGIFSLILLLLINAFLLNINTPLYNLISTFLIILLLILFFLFNSLAFMKILYTYEREDFQIFLDINLFYYYQHFFFIRKKNYKNMLLLNMAYACIELGDFWRFEQCMALIYKWDAGRFKKMYGFSNPKEKLRLTLQKISSQSEEIKIAYEYLMKKI